MFDNSDTETQLTYDPTMPETPSETPQDAAGAPVRLSLTDDPPEIARGAQNAVEKEPEEVALSERETTDDEDDDNPLAPCPEDMRPCSICGQAAAPVTATKVVVTQYHEALKRATGTWELTMEKCCGDCQRLYIRASGLGAKHFRMTHQQGYPDPMTAWLGVVLAHELMGAKPPAGGIYQAEARVLLRELAGFQAIRWRVQVKPPTMQQVAVERFGGARMNAELMQNLRNRWARVLAWKASRIMPPQPVPCPSAEVLHGELGVRTTADACLMCGVGKVLVPAQTLVGFATPGLAVRSMWTSRTYRGVKGHTCAACSAAIAREGAIGPTADERALLTHLDPDGSAHLAAQWGASTDLGVNPFAAKVAQADAAGLPVPKPNPTPWSHLGEREKVLRKVRRDLGMVA